MKMRKIGAGVALLALVAGTVGLTSCKDNNNNDDPTNETEKTLSEITVSGATVEFTVGGTFSKGNLKVTAKYSDNSTADVTADATVDSSKVNMSAAGEYTVTVTYQGKTATYKVTVKPQGTQGQDPDDDRIHISTAEDFVNMLTGQLESVNEGSGLIGDYVLDQDIDMTGVTIENTAPYSFQGTFDGNGHTISNLSLSPAKKQTGLFEGLYDATIQNVKFTNVTLTTNAALTGSDAKGLCLFGLYSAGATLISNVTIDGFNMEIAENQPENGGLIVNAYDTLVLQNIAIVNATAKLGNYSGLVVGTMKEAGQVTVAGAKIDVGASSIEAYNILIDADIEVFNAASQQGNGVLIGRISSANSTQNLIVDGFVYSGTIYGGKNCAPIMGDQKTTALNVSIKNAYFLEGGSFAQQNTQTNTFIGQQKNPDALFENCYYVDRSVTIAKDEDYNAEGVSDYVAALQGEAIAVEDVVAPTDAFTVADGKISLNGVSIDLPAPVVTAAVDNGTLSYEAKAGLEATVEGNIINISGKIPYYTAEEVDGTAGNYVKVTIAKPATLTDKIGGKVYFNDSIKKVSDLIELYVPVAALEAGVTEYQDIVVTVRWNNNAIDQTYTIKIANDVTFATPLVYGAISQDDANYVTENPDNYTLHYTSGTIAWDSATDPQGNYVTVKIAKPEWASEITDLSQVTLTNAIGVSLDGDVLTVKVAAKAAGASFNVKWTDEADPQQYNITVSDAVVLEANPNASLYLTLDVNAVMTQNNIALDDTGKGAAIADGTYGDFTISGGAKRANSSTVSIEISKQANGGKVAFSVTQASTITLEWSSTGSSNASSIALYKADGTLVETYYITGSNATEITLNAAEAGDYYIASPGTNTTDGVSTSGRGFRLYSLSVAPVTTAE